MIRVMHESSDFMYKLFTGIGRFYSSIALNFTKEGINGAKLTDDKVALISFSLPPTAFREFEVENPVSLTLDLGALKKSLSKLRSANSSFLLLESNGELKIVVMDQKEGSGVHFHSRLTRDKCRGDRSLRRHPLWNSPASPVP